MSQVYENKHFQTDERSQFLIILKRIPFCYIVVNKKQLYLLIIFLRK